MSHFLKQIATKLKFNPKRLLLLLIPCFFLATTSSVNAATSPSDIPDISQNSSNWIVDQAEVLSPINENRVNERLQEISEQSGADVKFVVIRRLNYGETVDSFAEKLFDQWYSTPEEKANKALLIFDTLTNNTTLRVGDNLKDRLSDDIAESIVKDTIGVPIREDDKYNEALLNATERLVPVLAGEPDPGPPEVEKQVKVERTYKKAEETDTESAAIWVIGLLIVATIIPMATYFAYVLFTN